MLTIYYQAETRFLGFSSQRETRYSLEPCERLLLWNSCETNECRAEIGWFDEQRRKRVCLRSAALSRVARLWPSNVPRQVLTRKSSRTWLAVLRALPGPL